MKACAPFASILKSFSSGAGYEFVTKVCFLWSVTAFAELAHKSRYHCEHHTTESERNLNYQQLTFAVLSFVCADWTELTSEILSELFSTLSLSEMLFLFINCLNIHFCEHFLQIRHNLRTINHQINIAVQNLHTLARKFEQWEIDLYLNTTIGQIKNLRKNWADEFWKLATFALTTRSESELSLND